MTKIYFGKISKNYPEQYDENFYAGGNETSTWYGGMQPGDYVFPIFNSAVKKLWRVREYSNAPNHINAEGSIQFDVVKEFPEPISISAMFARYKYFELDLVMVNKLTKSTASEKVGFYPIATDKDCPAPNQIDFKDARNIYITVEAPFKEIIYKDNDIRILIDGKLSLKIQEIQIYKNNGWQQYKALNDLYLEKNPEGQRYSLKELLDYAVADRAVKKEKFLDAVIDSIGKTGSFTVMSPVGLYDNLLVGRKKTLTGRRDPDEKGPEVPVEEESDLTKEDVEDFKEYIDLLKFSPNLILYGPPGTGKTYSAQKIIEAFEFDRTNKEKTFKQIQNEGRVNFVTFHQSFSYEEFVEGLRPVINNSDDEKENNEAGNLQYKVQPGILLNIANSAALSQITHDIANHDFEKIKESNRIWKISLGEKGTADYDDVFKSCIETNSIAIGFFPKDDLSTWDYDKTMTELSANLAPGAPRPTNHANSINNFINEIQEGDLVLVFASNTTIRAIGMVDGPYVWKKELVDMYPQRRKVKWLKVFNTPIDILKYNGGKKLSQVTLYEMSNVKFLDIKELLDTGTEGKKRESKNTVPYFLIIDEINRGNISKIFGELITLVEKDKRDRIKVKLPYSQKDFSLPMNLYIIGTMNTTDRSIAILDTALRRRFVFKEIEPSSDVLRKENQFVEDLDVAALLDKLNTRISEKLDRDHRIGHSYFTEPILLSQLRTVWYHQIIPLLMEYFYDDAKSIKEIITEAFIDENTSQIKMIESDAAFKKALLGID